MGDKKFCLFRSNVVHVTDSHYLCLENNLKCKDMADITVDMSKIKQMLQLQKQDIQTGR